MFNITFINVTIVNNVSIVVSPVSVMSAMVITTVAELSSVSDGLQVL